LRLNRSGIGLRIAAHTLDEVRKAHGLPRDPATEIAVVTLLTQGCRQIGQSIAAFFKARNVEADFRARREDCGLAGHGTLDPRERLEEAIGVRRAHPTRIFAQEPSTACRFHDGILDFLKIVFCNFPGGWSCRHDIPGHESAPVPSLGEYSQNAS
jgi:hypothetical protein